MSQKLLPLNPRQMVGLADGNSFYCSCEESVQPWLYGKPIIVASNNDGCVRLVACETDKQAFIDSG